MTCAPAIFPPHSTSGTSEHVELLEFEHKQPFLKTLSLSQSWRIGTAADHIE
jgi:hypothetical protein